MDNWILLVLSLPTENATVRMRAWRALKSSGAAVLKDGVYLLPERPQCRESFESIMSDIVTAGGIAYLLETKEPQAGSFRKLFDRSAEYLELLSTVMDAQKTLTHENFHELAKQTRKIRKQYAAITEIDFFSGEAKEQVDTALTDLELAILARQSPDEPNAVVGTILKLNLHEYQNRIWATRKRPWVDRLASAWLIKRFIDSNAKFIWLDSPKDCPPTALGFDFDDAAFSHVDGRVTFEVLAASFSLDNQGLTRLGHLVHYLDVGGVSVPESVGVETILGGWRESVHDDDQLLILACTLFDGLLSTFKTTPPQGDAS